VHTKHHASLYGNFQCSLTSLAGGQWGGYSRDDHEWKHHHRDSRAHGHGAAGSCRDAAGATTTVGDEPLTFTVIFWLGVFAFAGNPLITDDEIRGAVTTGIAAANADYGTSLFPGEIKEISESGNDSLERAAFLIIERLATRGDGGFELVEG
jgi:hypothetical protein